MGIAGDNWFNSSLGQWLLEEECRHCRRLIPAGYYPTALQVGLPGRDYLRDMEDIEVGTRFISRASVGDQAGAPAEADTEATVLPRARHLVAQPGALPFGERTHSLIVLPHVLDFCADPHRVLREVNQVLIPEGCVVITGFNRFSLWGLNGLPGIRSRANVERAPWRGKHYRARRVQDWLSLLGIDILGACQFAYQPPMQSPVWRARLGFLDRMGDRWWPALGAVYMIVGRKREIAVGTSGHRLAWRRFIPAIARPGVTASGIPASAAAGRSHLRLVVKNPA